MLRATARADDGPVRADIAELARRRALTEDAARPDAVVKRHKRGGRTARENVADLIDDGSWVEWGRYAVAAQRQLLDHDDLIARTPADGIVAGIGTVDDHPTAVLAYDYTVLAGTQGMRGHRKSDRMLDVIERSQLPVVFFAEGGGGRPSDTDIPLVSALDVESFALWAGLSGKVPRISIVNGSCFAGNAVIAGCSDFLVATRSASIGMAGPAMIAGAAWAPSRPRRSGRYRCRSPTASSTFSSTTRRRRPPRPAGCSTAISVAASSAGRRTSRCLFVTPSREQPDRVRHLRVVERLADEDSVTVLRPRFAPELITALARIEGRPVGLLANNSMHMAGTVTGEASDKAARFMRLLRCLRPADGVAGGHPATWSVQIRRPGPWCATAAACRSPGLRPTVPTIAVFLRRGYGPAPRRCASAA